MRQVTRKGLITMAAAGGVLALGGGYANADAGAHGGASNSPGVASGNAVQVPVDVPVNACGNSVNVVGLLNPVFGNECANKSGPAKSKHGKGGAHGSGGAENSPGVASGNHINAPVNIPVNACGNTVTIGGLLNPALGNDCANDSELGTPGKPGPDKPEKPGTVDPPGQPRTVPPADAPPPTVRNGPDAQTLTPAGAEELAQTGTDAMDLLIPAGAGMLLAGAVLYRRARSAA
ncbi:chaplin [Streptomyces sp. AM8-1-1]|uniref:chaplin n=1 Tax=Streptomyces sp. AM8-1-1 TaxID=3075825 RepID=UPI0028C49BFA|nr:chaplin family protein [Streptomyces sp. AM8-1-1]WNO75529.1 chaplin family protein [Streptomyces sp. AM8-1-1]